MNNNTNSNANIIEEEKNAWKACAENLVEYAYSALLDLESWGKDYPKTEREIEMIRKAISQYDELANKKENNTGKGVKITTKPEPSRLEIAAMFYATEWCDGVDSALMHADKLISAHNHTKSK
jgi:hypothetical protein